MNMTYLLIIVGVIVLILIIKLLGSEGKAETIDETDDDLNQLIQSGRDGSGFIVIQGASYANQVIQELQSLGYSLKGDIPQKEEKTSAPNYKEMTQDKEFIYANVGQDSKEIMDLVKLLFRKVYDYTDFDKMNVQLALNG